MVRAKFKVTRIETQVGTARRRLPDGSYAKNEQGHDIYDKAEQKTLVLHPVYGNGDPKHENSQFWDATPSGELRLGTVNPNAWKMFELDKEYYIDISPAE